MKLMRTNLVRLICVLSFLAFLGCQQIRSPQFTNLPVLDHICLAVYRPAALAIDRHHDLIATSDYENAVLVFAPGMDRPTRVIEGHKTLLSNPLGVAVDSRDRIYVSNYHSNAIVRFSSGANGNASPEVLLAGSKTRLDGPGAIQLDSSDDLYVIESAPDSLDNEILEYSSHGVRNRSPIRIIAGPNTMLSGASNLRVDRFGEIVAASFITNFSFLESSKAYILVFSRAQSGDAAPAEKISLPTSDRLFTLNKNGDLYVLGDSDAIELWLHDQFTAPSVIGQVLGSLNTTDLAVDGNLLYTADYQNGQVCRYSLH
jgi:hypothetical protein